jgi:DUF4097 and DUF4098 domain-containing protein YvlB
MPFRNLTRAAASLPSMSTRDSADVPRSSAEASAVRRALWALFASGLLLMLAAAASGEAPVYTATRADRFNATLSPGTTVRVTNVNGDVVASPGRAFAAVATTTVTATSQARADQILRDTTISARTDDDGDYRLETRWPGDSGSRHRDRRRGAMACRDCRIVTRYEISIPAGVGADLQTVNGELRVRDLDGDLELQNVNGNIQVAGARRALDAQTVNGKVEAAAAALPPGSDWELQTVNGSVVATLPKDAKFEWNASTMSGTISSTFALPPWREAFASLAPKDGASGRRTIVVREGKDGEVVVDAEELAREIEESFEEVQVEIPDSFDWTDKKSGKTIRRVKVHFPERHYEATVGGGGSEVRSSTLNGNIVLLAAGTQESDAKALVSARRPIVVTVPPVRVRVPRPRVVVAPPAPEAPDADLEMAEHEGEEDGEVKRGDVTGNFLSTSNASYRVGRVSGTVKILTHSGEIHVASVGNGAEVKTFGGDIRLGPVTGDLRAQTHAGDVRIGEVTGSAAAETSGGDIRIERVAGAVNARTGGGDIVIPSVGGSVQAETGGGEVRIGVANRRIPGGITIVNAGGDVLLTLPADFQADLDLEVEGPAEPEDLLIRCDFPGVAVVRGADTQRASGSLNGGGPKLKVRTTSGSIRLRKAS